MSVDELTPLGEGTETRYLASGKMEVSSTENRDEEWIATDSPVEIQQ